MVAIYEDGDEPGEVYHVTDLPLYDALAMVGAYNRREYSNNDHWEVSTVDQFPLLPRWIEIEETNELTS